MNSYREITAKRQPPESEKRERRLGGRSLETWIGEYAGSHRHPVNAACHLVGIPLLTFSILLAVLLLPFRPDLWGIPAGVHAFGWVLQFVGHAFEGKPPEFLRDWRFLLVGFRWWWRKIRGRA